MKAHVCRRYGGPEVVELVDLPDPVPGPRDILVRIHATTVTSGDWRVRTLTVPPGMALIARLALGITGPRQPILGTELAGVVEAVGEGVARFRPGDAVMAFPGSRMGCHAEYRVLAEDGPVVPKPAGLSHGEAAALPFGASTAIHFLRRAAAARGERVLVIGAAGGVGTALVQVARHLGCTVTGVASAANAELVASLGAARVIDYARENPVAPGETYDIIADVVGASSLSACRAALAPGGRFLAIAGGVGAMLASAAAPLRRGARVIAGPAEESPAMLREIAALAEAGALRPVIGRTYPFAEMREAHAHVETGHKRGSVVVQVVPDAAAAG